MARNALVAYCKDCEKGWREGVSGEPIRKAELAEEHAEEYSHDIKIYPQFQSLESNKDEKTGGER